MVLQYGRARTYQALEIVKQLYWLTVVTRILASTLVCLREFLRTGDL